MGVLRRRQWWGYRGLVVCLFVAAYFVVKLNLPIDGPQNANVDDGRKSSDNKLRMRLEDARTVEKSNCEVKPETLKNSCSNLNFKSLGPLPNASVIITFHDSESISNLLHTIHSVIQRSSSELLEEVIVIDDFSQKEEFRGILENYIRTIFPDKVKLHRNSKNLGLIKSRLKGVHLARGEVLYFIDSHSEVQDGWLEPLLFEIKKNRKCLANSLLDWMERIDDDRWKYDYGCTTSTVVFDWSMGFGWNMKPAAEIKENITESYKSRSIIGSSCAIEKKFFQEIGEYDEGMEFWGGENIDISIRTWLFDGEVITVPCSGVAHFEGKDSRSYRSPYQSTIQRNYKRLAEVWFDEYKECFYYFFPHLITVDAGDLTERLKVKASAPHDMKWYHQNVFSEMGCPVKDGLAVGPISNKQTKTCLALHSGYSLSMAQCSENDRTQILIYWSVEQHLREPNYIYHAVNGFVDQSEYLFLGNKIQTMKVKWIHWKDGPLIETQSKLCLEAPSADDSNGKAKLMPCDFINKTAQIWSFRNYTQRYENLVQSKSIEVNVDVKEFQNIRI